MEDTQKGDVLQYDRRLYRGLFCESNVRKNTTNYFRNFFDRDSCLTLDEE